MKIIIAGGRFYNFTIRSAIAIDIINTLYGPITEIVSGSCTGADKGGESYAKLRGIDLKIFKADWNRNGKAAGPIRNKKMAEYADGVVLFPGGRGTQSMYNEAKKAKIKIFDLRNLYHD
jgi:hypothetical protein